ncbi:serine/threonine protein kinase [Histoplasma capsulatum H143]|uniref:Serine/threonine protein kinase n=1 Tax=Ajellomyces capsulatus (strain H143) TaxID=544712 RepID=C6H1N6_AJECH|nr:serine/threonine protein kinase [Histoplasma capsulatum H143]
MVSTGTMTTPSPRLRPLDSPPFSQRSKSRLPNSLEKRHSAQQFESENEKTPSGRDVYISRGAFFKRESKQNASFEDLPRSPVSSRPSLEGSRPSALDTSDPTARSKSANSKSRPASSFIGSRSERFRDFDSPRDSLDSSFPRGGYDGSDVLHHPRLETDRDHERANISSDIDFLRAKEVEESNRKREKRVSSGSKHMKRSSLTSISLSGTKNLLAGRFGDAFRRFENNAAQERTSRSPSPDNVNARLTPITGSEVTEMSDDGCEVNDGDISPEMRRELERRRLSLEERRVANAAAEYRQRLAERGEDGARGGGRIEGVRAASIQSKVQSLLKENDRHPTVKTASGYGRYTDTEAALQAKQFEQPSIPPRAVPFNVPRKPVSIQQQATEQAPRPQPKDPRSAGPLTMPIRSQQPTPSEQFVSRASTTAADQKPPAPPKPQNLRTGNRTENVVKEHNPPIEMAKKTSQNDDWEANFSKRYPSLSGLELVETEIDIPTPRVHAMRTKEACRPLMNVAFAPKDTSSSVASGFVPKALVSGGYTGTYQGNNLKFLLIVLGPETTLAVYPANVEASTNDLKDVIQHLFEIQSAVHGYLGSETQQELVRKIEKDKGKDALHTLHHRSTFENPRYINSSDNTRKSLTLSLSTLSEHSRPDPSASPSQTSLRINDPDPPLQSVQLPPEIIDYVDAARNPDIYTREFVELVQRGNQDLKGKVQAFASFRDILAREMASAMPECKGEVERVLRVTGGSASS